MHLLDIIVLQCLPSLVVNLTSFCLKWERYWSIWPIKNHFVLNSKRVPLENLKRVGMERRASGGQSQDFLGRMDIWLLNDLFSVISIITAAFSPSHTHNGKTYDKSRYTIKVWVIMLNCKSRLLHFTPQSRWYSDRQHDCKCDIGFTQQFNKQEVKISMNCKFTLSILFSKYIDLIVNYTSVHVSFFFLPRNV